MPHYSSKVDRNQAEVVAALRAAGWVVIPMNVMRGKWLDLAISKQGVTIAVEVKMPGEALTESERKFVDEWAGLTMVAYSGQEAVDTAAKMLEFWKAGPFKVGT